jgi:hypothetical protein
VNVGELRARLAGVPDSLDVVVRASGDDGTSICNTPWNAGRDTGCDDEEFFAIEVSETDEEPALLLVVPGAGTGEGTEP